MPACSGLLDESSVLKHLAPLHLGACSNARETRLPSALNALPASALPRFRCAQRNRVSRALFQDFGRWALPPANRPTLGRLNPIGGIADKRLPPVPSVPEWVGSHLAGGGLDALAPRSPRDDCPWQSAPVARLPASLCRTPIGQRLRALLAKQSARTVPDRAYNGRPVAWTTP
jgi:hypothetical protein